MVLKFEEWLLNQQNRKDLIGDLARAMATREANQHPPRRKADEHKRWADIIIRSDEPTHIAIFNDAWQEYLTAKLTAEDPQT